MADLTRRELLAARRGHANVPERPSVPEHLHAVSVSDALVSIAWRRAHDHGRHVHYEVLRDGHRVAHVRTPAFVDRKVRASTSYRYVVRALAGKLHSRRSRTLFITTAALPVSAPIVPSAPPPPPAPPAPSPPLLSQAMVDRLFWRAGFGPTDAERAQWIAKPVADLVEFLLSAPNTLTAAIAPPTYNGNPIDPLDSDPELQMEWLDVMARSTNPLVERLTLFWHRHFAVSKDAGVASPLLLAYRDRLRRYADFSAAPTATFHDLALEMTTQDAAMSLYLTGFANVKKSPNENYAREFMELFTLGVTDASANANYSQSDVHNLARAFTGYQLNQVTGVVSFTPSLFDAAAKTILGQTGTFDAPGAVALVLSHPSHAPFLVTKLWGEFIAAPIPADALASLTSTYVQNATQLQPLLRGILSHPLIFDSLEEPTMIKAPIVYTVGVLRATGAPLQTVHTQALYYMQQQPYHPPNVAGWPGGLSWMTTGTSAARFSLVPDCQGLLAPLADIPGESATDAYARAYAACGSPWLAPATATLLATLATQAPVKTAAQRLERQYALRSLILGGPDSQVM